MKIPTMASLNIPFFNKYKYIFFKGKDKVNVHKRSSSDSQSHTIQPPTEENNIFNATFSQLYDSNSDPEAALLPKT
jgi:hypothetical protein